MQKPVVNVMVKAARLGGNVLLRHMAKLANLQVVEKARMDYASEADRKAEEAIVAELRRAHPDYAVLGEEGTSEPGKGAGSRFCWVIDPLDGTSNYLRGFPHWCVSLALVENGEPQHAVIYQPISNELFVASKGSGATVNDRRIRVTDRRELAGSVLATGFPPRERERLAPHLECLRALMQDAEDVRRTGSAALDLAYVASGRVDAYFEAGLKAWDAAAGVLLVREAGGKVSDYHGKPLPALDARAPDSLRIVAGNLYLVEQLQHAIAASGYGNA